MNTNNWLFYYWLALSTDLVTVEEFSSWIDERIFEMNKPAATLIELAFICKKGKSTILDAIYQETREDEFYGRLDKTSIVEALFAKIKEAYISNPQRIGELIKVLSFLSQYFGDDKDYSTMNTLDDYYELAKNGIWNSVDDIRIIFERLLSRAKV